MNEINKKKGIIVRNNDSGNITDVNSKQLIDKRFKEIGDNEDKIRKSEDDLWKWKKKKNWDLEKVLSEVKNWFFWEIFRYESYQKEGKFFDGLTYHEIKNKLEVVNRISEIIGSKPFQVFLHNKKTRQLLMDLSPTFGCSCRSLECYCIFYQEKEFKNWCSCKEWTHVLRCLKTEEEVEKWIEEYSQKIIKNFKEALREVERTVLKEKGVVWNCKEQEVDDYFWDRAIQNMYSLVKSLDKPIYEGDSKANWFNEQIIKLNDELGEEWIEQKKHSIEQIRKQSAKEPVYKQEITDQNSAEKDKNILDKKKDGDLGKQGDDRRQLPVTKSKNNGSYLVSVGLPVAIILVVVIPSAFWISQKRKKFKKNKNK